jgi:cytoskeletal protein RodZ
MEITPPATSWEKVNAAINPEPQTIVRPIFRKQSPLFRYAAAAIVVGLIGFAIIRFVISSSTNSGNAATAAEHKDSVKSPNTISGTSKEEDTSTMNASNESSLTRQNDNVVTANPPLKKQGKELINVQVQLKATSHNIPKAICLNPYMHMKITCPILPNDM